MKKKERRRVIRTAGHLDTGGGGGGDTEVYSLNPAGPRGIDPPGLES